MKIIDIREIAIPLNSTLRNAVFDFSQMKTSVVAVITEVIIEGNPVVGYAFNSTGRYACGAQMRMRFIPRILSADPDSLIDKERNNFDPEKILTVMMQGEKPGGHSDRSVGIGTIEVAIWDAIAKIEEKPVFRSIEEGLPLVRAANTGISAIVDPYGRIIKMLDVGVEGVINSGLPLALPRLTLYAKWGNVTSAGVIGLVIILIILLQILHLKFISHNGEST